MFSDRSEQNRTLRFIANLDYLTISIPFKSYFYTLFISMKTTLLLISCSLPVVAFSQANVDVTPNVKSATLYQNGALVTHEGDANLDAGKTTVLFHGLPSGIDKQSIQLSSNGDIVILSVTSHDDYLSINRNNSKVKMWQDSIGSLTEDYQSVRNEISILEDAKKLLDNNRSVGGTSTGTTVLAVKLMYEYYIKQVNEIDDSLLLLHKRENKYLSKIRKVSDEMAEWKSRTDTVANDVEATISSDKRQKVSFHLSYLTYDASWSPVYDLRAQDTKHSCQFSYKANISQHTGQDWNNIDLTLSSSNPEVSQTAPTLNPWYLSYAYTLAVTDASGAATGWNYNGNGNTLGISNASNYSVMKSTKNIDIQQKENRYETKGIGNTTTENQLSVEFHIDVPYTLPSDDKPHTVEIKKYDLNAIYHYLTIPKLQKDVFLLAGITQWEDLNILAGEVNIYYDGAYVGKSSITPEATSDTLNFSLGMDKKIVVKRTRTKDFSSSKWIGSTRTQTFGWVITLHNSQNDSLTMDVYDQIPKSTDKDIVVTEQDLGGAKENATGKLSWRVSMAAGETKKLTFSYSVKYPKDRTLSNLWQ